MAAGGAEDSVLGAFVDLAWGGISKAIDDSGFDRPTKKSATALVTAITTLGNTITSKKESLQKQINDLTSENARLQAQITRLQDQLATSGEENTATIQQLRKELDDAKAKLATNNALIPKLMSALTSKINELNTAMSADPAGGGAAARAGGDPAGPAGGARSKYFQKYLKYKQKYLSIKNYL